MKISKKVNRLSFLVLSLTLMIFFVIASGGCGGSSGGGSFGDVDDNNNNNNNNNSETVTVIDENYDLDGDGVPNILDFDNIEEVSYSKDDVIENKKISVPSRQYLPRLRDLRSADTFVMDVTAGTEYTVEISKGTKDKAYDAPIGENVPDVEIVNPQGNALTFLKLDTEISDSFAASSLGTDVIELSLYPIEDPYMVCYTFKPAVNGSYTIKLSHTSDDVGVNVDDDVTLFVYEELRNENGEAGYYARYAFEDEENGETINLSMSDIMALRKAWNELAYYQEWDDGSEELTKKALEAADVYLAILNFLKERYGIIDDEKATYGNTKEVVTGVVSEDDDDDDETVSTTVSASAVSELSAAAASGTKIKQELYGIPYTDDFQPGTGYFAITGVQANTNAIKKFDLNPPAKKKIVSNYTASFVSSQEDREKISTTTTGASLGIGGFGLNAGYTSKSKFKFGLTSTTFVIHYEEVESSYRVLDDEEYKLKTRAKTLANENLTNFRAKYGDYFVAGYKYGGTYDAFITITTTTMEELQAVKTELSAKFETSKGSFGANVGNETQETLKKNNATVSIQIKTAGIDSDKIPDVKTTTDNMNDVVQGLNSFRNALKNTSAEYYNPVYVMLKRYITLEEIEDAMDNQKYNPLVPMDPKHSTKVMAFNREKMIMDSYYNVISDLKDNQIDASVRNSYKREYEDIDNEISNGGDGFYAESNSSRMDSLKTKMENLSKRLKELGDRYVFYQILMSAQKKEESCQSNSITSKPFGYNGGSVGKKSFAVSTAVTADIGWGTERSDFRNQYSGKSWEPTFTANQNYVFCWVEVTANNTHDVERTADLYCIGRRSASFHFTCGVGRWLEWTVKLQSMRFNATLYPFNGLK